MQSMLYASFIRRHSSNWYVFVSLRSTLIFSFVVIVIFALQSPRTLIVADVINPRAVCSAIAFRSCSGSSAAIGEKPSFAASSPKILRMRFCAAVICLRRFRSCRAS